MYYHFMTWVYAERFCADHNFLSVYFGGNALFKFSTKHEFEYIQDDIRITAHTNNIEAIFFKLSWLVRVIIA